VRTARTSFAILATAGVVAAAAIAAGQTVLLNLKGGYADRELVACGIRHHYTFFHVARAFRMDGSVQPVPAGAWTVKVKVKRCSAGRFRTIWAGHARGKSDGTFTIAYTPRRAGALFARAYYYGVRPAARSDKQYFRVP
jgi:hypothetical protein